MREAFNLIQESNLQYEDTIVWLKPIKEIVGVIDKIVTAKTRNRKPSSKTPIVGYGVLFDSTPNNGCRGHFFRRIFIESADGISPSEVLPGVSVEKCKKDLTTSKHVI